MIEVKEVESYDSNAIYDSEYDIEVYDDEENDHDDHIDADEEAVNYVPNSNIQETFGAIKIQTIDLDQKETEISQ